MVPQMKMPSVMRGSHRFAQVPEVRIERSTFDRSHGYKTTFSSGYLVPFYVDEALPGDTFNLRMTAFARLTTALRPVMDNLYLETFFFAVPYRLVWSNFVKFMGEQEPSTFTAYNLPVFNAYAPTELTLSDYMGIPCNLPGGATIQHCSLWHRAYNLIYNQWFRDENLVGSATVGMGDGPDNIADYVLRRRGKRHDYFTSALPWPQKAAAGVSLPLGTSANVVQTAGGAPTFVGAVSGRVSSLQAAAAANPSGVQVSGAGNWSANETLNWQTTGLIADLSTATAATINAIRQAFQIQKYLERDARGGTRYIEKVWSHFGVKSPDARLQRAEYLGGGSTPVIVNPIAQTGPTVAGQTPLATLGGIGTVTAHGHGFSKSFTEHCLLLGIMNVRADLNYFQGLDRMYSRSTIYDMYWPEFAHIGEQSILNKEIYAQGSGNPTADASTFGYQERYAEYRYKPSRVTGLFRVSAPGQLGIWHLAQYFTGLPTLGQTFIEENPPISRVQATAGEPEFYFDSFIKLICARPMPVFGVPGLIDHF